MTHINLDEIHRVRRHPRGREIRREIKPVGEPEGGRVTSDFALRTSRIHSTQMKLTVYRKREGGPHPGHPEITNIQVHPGVLVGLDFTPQNTPEILPALPSVSGFVLTLADQARRTGVRYHRYTAALGVLKALTL